MIYKHSNSSSCIKTDIFELQVEVNQNDGGDHKSQSIYVRQRNFGNVGQKSFLSDVRCTFELKFPDNGELDQWVVRENYNKAIVTKLTMQTLNDGLNKMNFQNVLGKLYQH